MKKRIVFWTPLAIKSLEEVKAFILEQWNNQILDSFLEQLDYGIEQICNNPELAPTLSHSNYRRLVIHKNISLFYIDEPERIKLLLVWDNRQDPKDLLMKLTDANKY